MSHTSIRTVILYCFICCSFLLQSQQLQLDTFFMEDVPSLEIKHTNNSAINIENARYGVYVREALTGFRVENAEAQGVSVISAGNHGFSAANTGGHGFTVSNAGSNGVNVLESGQSGLYVGNAEFYGVLIDESLDALRVNETRRFGLYIDKSGNDAIRITDAGQSGISIQSTNGDGVAVVDAGDDAFVVGFAASDGLAIGSVGGDGIRVGSADGYSMNILGSKTGVASVKNHVARIFNFDGSNGGDVLALKVNGSGDPSHTSNFITFFSSGPDDSIDNAIGAIEGNGNGGVTFKTSGADFAEALLQMNPDEIIRPGDIVGVYAGKISLRTKGADQVMVITDRPAIIGNHGPEKEALITSNVSFIGQAPVRVQGPVRSGDWLIQSGQEDGLAKAVSITELQPQDVIIGQAWENIYNSEVTMVNTLIGVGYHQIAQAQISSLQVQVSDQRIEIEKLKKQLESLIYEIKTMTQSIKKMK